MKTKIMNELIDLCRNKGCSLKLEVTGTGIVATASRSESAGHHSLTHQSVVYLDRNDDEDYDKLIGAINSIQ